MAKKRKLQQPGGSSGSNKKRQQQQGGGKPHKAAGKPHKKQHHQPAADHDAEDQQLGSEQEEEELAVSDEDLEFVQQYGQQLGFLQQLDPQELDKSIKAKQQKQKEAAAAAAAAAEAAAAGAAGEDGDDSDAEAEEYERRPRAAEQERKGPSTQGLPVKTAAGEVVFAPNKQQQRLLTASRIRVEGVTVEDDLAQQQQQQQEQQEKKGGKHGRGAAAAAEEDDESASESEEEEGEPSAAAKVAQQVQKVAAEQPDLPPALLSLMSIADQARRREALKQQMALAAQHLLAEPEKHIGPGLRLLSVCASDADGVVARLALLSLLAVFKDLLPGYRIRGVSGEEAQMKVSKEVQALRDFEAALLKGYQAYLKTLLAAATATAAAATAGSSSGSSARLATARVAVRCMGQLLVAKPGFNYSSDLLQALVPQMVSSDREVAQLAVDAVRMLLQEDLQGKTSLEAVQLVADLVRKKRCVLDPSIVGALLVLRFEAVTPTQQGGEGVGRQAQKGGKKGRKRSKKKSDLERDLEEAQAAPDARELALLQSQMLEALFEVFFRVLKHCAASTTSSSNTNITAAADPAAAAAAADPLSGSGISSAAGGVLMQPWPAAKVHRKFPLLQPTLTGLGRYSHLISVEYFNDLMGVLQELLATGALPVRERLCVLLAALDILRGQGEALTIDRRAFYNQLYNTLQLVPLSVLYEGLSAAGSSGSSGQGEPAAAAAGEEESEQELLVEVQRALDAVRISQLGWETAAPGSSSSGSGAAQQPQQQQQPTAVLLLRCLEQQLLGVKQTDMARLAAFVKRLAGLMLSCSVGEALGSACLLWRLLKRYPKLVCLLEWEGGAPVGGQQYEQYCEDPSEAGAMASALWELPLLSQHYHPHTAAAAKLLLTLTPGSSRSHGTGAAGEAEGGDEAAAAGGGGGGRGAAGVGAIAGVLAGAMGPQQVAATYEAVRRGGFRPGPQVPRQGSGGQQGKGAAGGSSKAQMVARAAAAAGPLTDSLLAAVQQQQQQQESAAAAGAGASAAAAAVAANGVQQNGSSKKRKHHQQQGAAVQGSATSQQQQQQVAAAVEGVDMQAVEAAVRQQYRLSRQYRRNQQLRRQAATAARKVELFREHLIHKHQEQQQQQQQQARKKQKVADDGAGGQQHKKGKFNKKAQQH